MELTCKKVAPGQERQFVGTPTQVLQLESQSRHFLSALVGVSVFPGSHWSTHLFSASMKYFESTQVRQRDGLVSHVKQPSVQVSQIPVSGDEVTAGVEFFDGVVFGQVASQVLEGVRKNPDLQ